MRLVTRFLWSAAALLPVFMFTSAAAAGTPACLAADDQGIHGVYRFPGGALASVLPSGTEGQRRIIHFDSGKSHKLIPAGALQFHSGADLDSETPIAHQYRFSPSKGAVGAALSITDKGKKARVATQMALPEAGITFKSGDTELFGKLTLPASGKKPFKTVIFVHGSDPTASVDQEWLPHLLAANGIAAFVFDKRGTGCSKGQYVQHFGVLSDDVIAAARALKERPEVDKNRIGLAGFSQGGWVAPLAALKDPSIRFVVVAYGLAMSIAEEDRLEAPLKLRAAGVDDASIVEYQALNAALHQVARDKFADWAAFDAALDKFKDRPWLATAKTMQTWVGAVMQMGTQQAKQVAPQMFEHFFQPFYDPVPTLEKLATPMLWLIAAEDIEAPPEITLDVLKRLRDQGKPVSTVVFPHTDHGLHEFRIENGKRVRTQYAKDYFSTLVKWVKSQP